MDMGGGGWTWVAMRSGIQHWNPQEPGRCRQVQGCEMVQNHTKLVKIKTPSTGEFTAPAWPAWPTFDTDLGLDRGNVVFKHSDHIIDSFM